MSQVCRMLIGLYAVVQSLFDLTSRLIADLFVTIAEAAQPAWAELPASVRAACLIKLATLIEKNASKIAELDAISMGRPVGVQGLDLYASVSGFHAFFLVARPTSGKEELNLNMLLKIGQSPPL